MNRSTLFIVIAMLAIPLFVQCGRRSSDRMDVVDLDRVLEIFDQVMKSPPPEGETAPEDGAATGAPPTEEKPEVTRTFLDKFAAELNKANLITSQIGVQLRQTGAIEGFKDRNRDGSRSSNEPKLFTIQFDPEGKRIIATQEVVGRTYHRHHYYRHYGYGYYWGRPLFGSMYRRQYDYYDSPFRTRPNYSRMQIAPDNYHRSAVQRAKTSARSARSRGGSRSFRGGK